MNQVYQEVIEKSENGDSIYGTASPELIQKLTQSTEGVKQITKGSVGQIVSIPKHPLLAKLNSLLDHTKGHSDFCESIQAQLKQIEASNGYTPPLQMH